MLKPATAFCPFSQCASLTGTSYGFLAVLRDDKGESFVSRIQGPGTMKEPGFGSLMALKWKEATQTQEWPRMAAPPLSSGLVLSRVLHRKAFWGNSCPYRKS